MSNNYTLEISGLKKAAAAFNSSLAVYDRLVSSGTPEDEKNTLRAGVIQTFEFAYELCWKYMKRWISMNVSSELVDGVPRRELFRLGAESRLVDDVNKWMEFHNARNRTSHIYDENVAVEVFDTAREFLSYCHSFVKRLEQRI